jgi:hypothetical protein
MAHPGNACRNVRPWLFDTVEPFNSNRVIVMLSAGGVSRALRGDWLNLSGCMAMEGGVELADSGTT